MTEETTPVEQTEEAQNKQVSISIDQILASVVATLGEVTVPLKDLVTNYSNKTIRVDQNEDGSVTFKLEDLPVEAEESSTEDDAE
jgi:hypothetical protein